MRVTGTIRNGVVVLDQDLIPEGTPVNVEPAVRDEAALYGEMIRRAAAMITPEQKEEDAALVEMGSRSARRLLEQEDEQRSSG
jgi:hypothetical protein